MLSIQALNIGVRAIIFWGTITTVVGIGLWDYVFKPVSLSKAVSVRDCILVPQITCRLKWLHLVIEAHSAPAVTVHVASNQKTRARGARVRRWVHSVEPERSFVG